MSGVKSLTSGRLLARSAIWNFTGMAAPMLVALFAIPLLIDGMGKERFGMLSIIWMGVGYFSLFDLGLGRALTKLVSERLGTGQTDDMGPLIWTALALLATLGAIGGLIIFVLSGPLIQHVLQVDASLESEAVNAFRILGAGLPLVIMFTALVGLLEAHQRFGTIAAIRIPLGILTFAGPLATLQISPSLILATGILLMGRALALMFCFACATTARNELKTPFSPQKAHMKPLFSFGGWLTVTNIVGPLMTYLDRFFVGAILNMTSVTYYATPYEVLQRAQILSNSIMGVLFPAMATAAVSDTKRLRDLYSTSIWLLLCLMLPLTAGFFLLAPEALDIWLGQEFSTKSTPIVQYLAVGWMINTLARPSFTVLQSIGRPDLIAKTHLAELIPYLIALWFFTSTFGIVGTAMVWSLRVLVDTLILNELAGRQLPELNTQIHRTRISIAATLLGFSIAWFLTPFLARATLLLVLSIGAAIALWPMAQRLRQSNQSLNSSTRSATET